MLRVATFGGGLARLVASDIGCHATCHMRTWHACDVCSVDWKLWQVAHLHPGAWDAGVDFDACVGVDAAGVTQ